MIPASYPPRNAKTLTALAVEVLQGFEDGDDLVAAGGVEPDVWYRRAIEPKLGIEGDSHRAAPRRFPRSEPGNGGFPRNS